MKIIPAIAISYLTASLASAATITTTLEISGAVWNSGTFAGGTSTFTPLGGSPFDVNVSSTANSTATVDLGGMSLVAVSASATSIQTGITGLRNTDAYKDRVAWIELDVANFDVADGGLSIFLGSTAFGVTISNNNGLIYTTDGDGLVGFGNTVTSGLAEGSATLRFTTAPGMTFGQNAGANTLMQWTPSAIGNDLQITAVRFAVETQETVPEPSALLLGLSGLGLLSRRKR